ncbi:MAG: hypothetical protein ACJA2Q_001421 [Pseudohongiellaceae bacterium]|jgi:hypothetical protein
MKPFFKKILAIGAFIRFGAGITIALAANLAAADAISVFSIGNPDELSKSELIQIATADERARLRRPRGESYHGHSQAGSKRHDSAFRLHANKIENAYRNGRRSAFRNNQERRIERQEYGSFSYTSPPLRGGSSRRTRIIENPYADRLVTGITLTGLDRQQVHIKDVVAYPDRYLLSPLNYSLSQYDRPRFINTQNYIDYISVAAKRKEHFTVTFHYD